MATATITDTTNTNKNSIKDAPWYAVPTILAILMLSSGGFFVLLAHGISIMSGTGY